MTLQPKRTDQDIHITPQMRRLAALDVADAYAAAEGSLREFVRQGWHILEAKRPLVPSWHMDAVSDHIQALLEGKFTRLIVNVPPRSSKSTIISVMAPAWDWINHPERRWLTGSHKQELAIRDSMKARRIIDDMWYKTAWGRKFQLTTEQNTKSWYDNDQGGHRLTFGFNSGVTGYGGDIIAIDDPHSAQASQAEIENACVFYDQELSNRLEDPATGKICLVMQRLREDDLTGHILSREFGWQYLCLPLEYEPERKCVIQVTGFEDPRTEEGERLCPERYTDEYVAREKVNKGAWGFAGQYQQLPQPRGGGDMKTEWLQDFMEVPRRMDWKSSYQFWDTAGTDTAKSSKWCGMHFIQTRDDHFWLVDMVWDKFFYPDGKRAIKLFHDKWSPQGVIVENKSTGIPLFAERNTDPALRGINLFKWEPAAASKKDRMDVEATAIEAGRLHVMKNAPWRHDFNKAIMGFPQGLNQDIIDVLSMSLSYFRTRRRCRARVL